MYDFRLGQFFYVFFCYFILSLFCNWVEVNIDLTLFSFVVFKVLSVLLITRLADFQQIFLCITRVYDIPELYNIERTEGRPTQYSLMMYKNADSNSSSLTAANITTNDSTIINIENTVDNHKRIRKTENNEKKYLVL